MGEAIVITSGKGGVGKSTTTANVGIALADLGKKVILVDTDIGLRNLDVILGMENSIVYDIVDVIKDESLYEKALLCDPQRPNLKFLAAAQTCDKTAINEDDMLKLCQRLKKDADFVLIDCPAGIEQGFKNAVAGADKALVITMAEKAAIRDADRIIDLLAERGVDDVKFIINRIRPNLIKHGYMMNIDDAIDALCVQVIGIIPDDVDVIIAAGDSVNVVDMDSSVAGMAYRNIAKRLTGRHVPIMEMPDDDKFFRKLRKLFSKK
ncbi:MAG: septum site-determining protein MinD [Clostridia bacterium]|nr:septum site-determining protein MinD [Clostridia bacterium]